MQLALRNSFQSVVVPEIWPRTATDSLNSHFISDPREKRQAYPLTIDSGAFRVPEV